MRKAVRERTYWSLVETTYAAGCDPAQWPVLVQQIQRALPGTAVTSLMMLEGTAMESHSACAGLPQECIESYFLHYHQFNPYVALFRRFKLGEVQRLSELVEGREIKKGVFYNEWLKPAGDLTYGGAIALLRDSRRLLRFGIDVPDRYPQLERPAAELLGRLGPHIIRAFEVNDKLAAASVTTHTVEALIEQISGAALLLSASGHVIFLNSKAEKLARARTLFRVTRERRLLLSGACDQEAYERSLASVLSAKGDANANRFTISCTNSESRLATVLPLSQIGRISTTGAQHARALLVIADGTREAADVNSLLKLRYRLTPAEADVVVRLAEGGNTSSIAQELALSKITVRNQIASAMVKIGVHRQAALVAEVLSLTPRLRT